MGDSKRDWLGRVSLAAALTPWLALAVQVDCWLLFRLALPQRLGDYLVFAMIGTLIFAAICGSFSYSRWGSRTGELAVLVSSLSLLLLLAVFICGVFFRLTYLRD